MVLGDLNLLPLRKEMLLVGVVLDLTGVGCVSLDLLDEPIHAQRLVRQTAITVSREAKGSTTYFRACGRRGIGCCRGVSDS